ncbi:hypothetical protein NB693_25225 [Pantoea ananatis]|uniref:hypothetical protein n=1 Tax=Pantoea ananas TaxID=553 RepID=UPI0022209B98|nr:hypothetical protein [Pantoea ananatis]
MEGHLPNRQMPFIWGDFNACGWAAGGDESIYALDKDALAAIPAKDGMAIFVWCAVAQCPRICLAGLVSNNSFKPNPLRGSA